MWQMFVSYLALLYALHSLTGCSRLDALDEMNDTTRHMSNQLDSLNTQMESLEWESLQNGSSAVRSSAIERVFDADLEFEGRIKEAARYFSAFEFQFWSDRQAAQGIYRERLEEEALLEFGLDLRAHLPAARQINPLSQKPPDLGMMALSFALTRINPLQTRQDRSMLTILAEELGKDTAESEDPFRRSTATFRTEYLTVLQWRYNTLVAATLEELLHFSKMNFLQKAKLKLRPRVSLQLSTTDVPLIRRTIREYLLPAQETLTILKEVGAEAQLNPTVKDILLKLDVAEEASISPSSASHDLIILRTHLKRVRP